ncbi:hypothetical protein A7K91_19935 [Paenibacillus oryzae]|uniref:Copper amine oxidase-like N-terminal domain-containing protein n=1 Tax=Paenibacillus oryzae TaxID=1844972 RepID=A0A1A5YI35_9BACL|nr:TraB/GumN family protein [Paenibacillus oryzae]OBR65257.1 hypothetical protein A7K91_19935 [Paenibacillus oryzae]
MNVGIKIEMKKITVLLFSFILLFVLSIGGAPAQASASKVHLALGDEKITFNEGQPYIEQATTLIPAKAFLEGLEYELSWDAATSTLYASKGELSFELKRGQKQAMANGENYLLNVAPKIVDGILYAPLRFLAENAGYRVGWDAANRAVALEPQDSKGFFWKVEKDGSELYLLGSIHHGNEEMYPMHPELNAAYANSEHLVVEINITVPMSEQRAADIEDKYMWYNDNTTLADHIDPETYTQLKSLFEESGALTAEWDSLKAWVTYMQLLNLNSAQDGYGGALGIDMYFLQKAFAAGKSILELESLELQYEMLNNFSDELMSSLIKETIEAFHQPDSSIESMANIWLDGDEAALVEMVEAMKAIPEYYQAIIKDRNVGMLEKIEGYLEDKSKETYFVVVGAAHMVGEDGIVTRLKEKGYTVTRL